MKKIGGLCGRDDCDRPFYGKGLCRKHYDERRNEDKERLAAQNKKYYEENRERILEAKRAYRADNPEVSRRGTRNRRARKRASAVSRYTEAEVIAKYGADCHICLGPINLDAPRRTGLPGWELGLHIDHVDLISHGGEDSVENVRPAHGRCNLRKTRRRSA